MQVEVVHSIRRIYTITYTSSVEKLHDLIIDSSERDKYDDWENNI